MFLLITFFDLKNFSSLLINLSGFHFTLFKNEQKFYELFYTYFEIFARSIKIYFIIANSSPHPFLEANYLAIFKTFS